jgi:hypothetical protein
MVVVWGSALPRCSCRCTRRVRGRRRGHGAPQAATTSWRRSPPAAARSRAGCVLQGQDSLLGLMACAYPVGGRSNGDGAERCTVTYRYDIRCYDYDPTPYLCLTHAPPARATFTTNALLDGIPRQTPPTRAWSSVYRHARRPLKRSVGGRLLTHPSYLGHLCPLGRNVAKPSEMPPSARRGRTLREPRELPPLSAT